MKNVILMALATMLAFAACVGEMPAPETVSSELYALIDQDAQTKTVMDESNNIRWSEGDQVVAFMKTSLGLRYQIKDEYVGKTSGYFWEVASDSSNDLGAGTEWNHNVVYYPYSADVEAVKSGENYSLSVVLPTEQTYASESFGNGSFPMVAVSEDNNITFKNVLGGMKIQLRGSQKVKSITLQGKNNEKLAGAATVTAYTDEAKPAITMTSSASTSVTVVCDSGIQLNESKPTEFIISLPPVLFSEGFTVTVADAEGQTYTVGTDKVNTVLRSSILTMPAFKLGEAPELGSPENAVDMIAFDFSELTVVPGSTHSLTVDFEPYDAKDKTLVWNSSDPSVASVDASGVIKALADGTSTITAVAIGGATASCTVTVMSCVVPSIDYIDNGVNYGKGIAVGDVVWAPVNCGYEAPTDNYKGYPYGKLYQWGRKYGQGYNCNDASYPSGDNRVEGPVMPSVANAEENKDKFYYVPESPNDWSRVQKDDLWNSGTESNPVKTEYDPCPEGWRIPTFAELDRLNNNYSSWITVENQEGRYLCGDYTYLDTAPQVFFPAAGCLGVGGGYGDRDYRGYYWSSKSYSTNATNLQFASTYVWMHDFYNAGRAEGNSVRCVQE